MRYLVADEEESTWSFDTLDAAKTFADLEGDRIYAIELVAVRKDTHFVEGEALLKECKR